MFVEMLHCDVFLKSRFHSYSLDCITVHFVVPINGRLWLALFILILAPLYFLLCMICWNFTVRNKSCFFTSMVLCSVVQYASVLFYPMLSVSCRIAPVASNVVLMTGLAFISFCSIFELSRSIWNFNYVGVLMKSFSAVVVAESEDSFHALCRLS